MVYAKAFLIGLVLLIVAPAAHALELIMVERQGCHYCDEWKEDVGPAYPNTEMGKFAPLRMVDIRNSPPEGVTFDRRVVFTPTFVLVENGAEIGRIEGHPGEDFFWGLLFRLLTDKAGYEGPG